MRADIVRSRISILVLCFLVIPGMVYALQPKQPGDLNSKEFFKPELSISSSNVPFDRARSQLPNLFDWDQFFTEHGRDFHVFIDPRSGTPANIEGHIPLIPGKGVENRLTLNDLANRLGHPVGSVTANVVSELVVQFLTENRGALAIDLQQLGKARSAKIAEELWNISIPQMVRGIPVRYSRIAATINNGNLVLIGTDTWGNVRISTQPKITANEALGRGFSYIGGRSQQDQLWKNPQLEIIPYATELKGASNKSYDHYLAWVFGFKRDAEDPLWEILVNAHTGEVLAFQDVNEYANKKVVGGVYPITSTEICPTAETCGTMQSQYPMPWCDTGLAAPNNFTNSAGVFDYTGGTVTTTLSGKYVRITDTCGAMSESSSTGDLDLGGINGQHDCTVPSGHSSGDTSAGRTAFYEVNKLAEMARGWLPANAWLQSQLTTNVNIVNTCNAFYSTLNGTINFYRSGGGCRNTGEIAQVFDHEWGHGLDDNDSAGVLSNSSEGYADIAANYRLQASCVGHGFFWTSNRGCGQTSDGTGFNQNENQVGGLHCDLDCSGVRDADWDKHADHLPDTALGFVCGQCGAGSGPCGRQVHCAAAPVRQAAWDLVARDLRSAPFNYDSNTAFITGSKIFFQGSGNIGSWHACTCGASSDGCGATNGYMQWLAADDDNGNTNDGTPHMTAIFNAFNRHGIACSTPAPTNSGCSGAPAGMPTVTPTPGDTQVALSWTPVTNAQNYWVLRTEGHAGCNLGKALIATVGGTSYTDTQVGNDRQYNYVVMAVGSSNSCFAPASLCVSATPTAGGCTPPAAPTLVSPSNGATGVSTTPTLDWNDVAGATSYEVQVATDAAFNNVVASATGLATSSWTVSPALNNNTSYFWRSRAVNTCGPGPYAAAFSFTTAAAPVGDFSISCSPSSLSIAWGNSNTSTCTITSINGFNSPVNLACSGQGTKVTCSFSPNPVTPPANSSINSILTVNVQRSARTGTRTFQVVGTSGALSHSFGIQLTVTKK